MANKIITFREFSASPGTRYLFDTNIWMLLFCPLGNVKKEKQEKASKVLERIISVNAAVVVTSLILSEFSNAYLRLAYEQWRKRPENVSGKFKSDYFNSNDSLDNRLAITSAISNILQIKSILKFPDNFNNIGISKLLDNFKTIDFNDCFIIETCLKESFTLVTDDADFEKIISGINIVNI
jgi:predicted nucleic acid-binding protein